MLRSRFLWLALLASVGIVAACAINPQPLPPDTYEGEDAGVANVPSGGGDNAGSTTTLADGSAAAPTTGLDGGESGNVGDDGGTFGLTDGGEADDAGDAGDAGDASLDGGSEDAGDAEADASDASRDR